MPFAISPLSFPITAFSKLPKACMGRTSNELVAKQELEDECAWQGLENDFQSVYEIHAFDRANVDRNKWIGWFKYF